MWHSSLKNDAATTVFQSVEGLLCLSINGSFIFEIVAWRPDGNVFVGLQFFQPLGFQVMDWTVSHQMSEAFKGFQTSSCMSLKRHQLLLYFWPLHWPAQSDCMHNCSIDFFFLPSFILHLMYWRNLKPEQPFNIFRYFSDGCMDL